MTNVQSEKNQVKIIAADLSLKKKLGSASLDQIFSAKVVQRAQDVIKESSDEFIKECFDELNNLKQAVNKLSDEKKSQTAIRDVISSSFSIKAKAAIGGYDLVSTIANSLHLRCEILGSESVVPSSLAIIKWHEDTLGSLLKLGVKGSGGQMGDAILQELGKVAVKQSAA